MEGTSCDLDGGEVGEKKNWEEGKGEGQIVIQSNRQTSLENKRWEGQINIYK